MLSHRMKVHMARSNKAVQRVPTWCIAIGWPLDEGVSCYNSENVKRKKESESYMKKKYTYHKPTGL